MCEARGCAEDSEVEDRHVEEVTDAFTLIQVIDVVVISRWRGEAEQGSEHCGKRSPLLVAELSTPTPSQEAPLSCGATRSPLGFLHISLVTGRAWLSWSQHRDWQDSKSRACVQGPGERRPRLRSQGCQQGEGTHRGLPPLRRPHCGGGGSKTHLQMTSALPAARSSYILGKRRARLSNTRCCPGLLPRGSPPSLGCSLPLFPLLWLRHHGQWRKESWASRHSQREIRLGQF